MKRRVLVVGVLLVTLLLAAGGMAASFTPITSGPPTVPTRAITAPTQLPVTPKQQKPTPSKQKIDPLSGLPWVDLSALPKEASETLRAIKAGPPFPGRKDGVTFFNREGKLPQQVTDYYHEFTVPTPGDNDRGARRIVSGGPRNGLANNEYYYTGDHYASFERIRT